MTVINFEMKQCRETHSTRQNVCISLELLNNSEKDLYFSRDSLLLDGFTTDKFVITDVNTCYIPYIGPSVKYHPEKVKLESHGSISSQLNLAEEYDFEGAQAGQYKISFTSYAYFCADENYTGCNSKTLHDEILINIPELV